MKDVSSHVVHDGGQGVDGVRKKPEKQPPAPNGPVRTGMIAGRRHEVRPASGWRPAVGSRSRPGTRSGRSRACFVLLPALALLAAAPVQAQQTVWSATLTVKTAGDSNLGCHESFRDDRRCSSALTDNDFSYGGADYTVEIVNNRVDGSSLAFGLQPAIPAAFGTLGAELHVGGAQLAFADASLFFSNTLATWGSPGLSWTVNQQVSLSIVLPPPRSSNANLSGLTASSGTSAPDTFAALPLTPSTFSASTTSYAATVANAITHVKLTPTVQDTGKATVTVDGTPVSSGSASEAIALSEGANAITVRVTAENGTTKDYTVTVTRQQAQPTPTVSLLASPNPVTEGGTVTVTATLSRALASNVTIPVTLTDHTAEPDDHGPLASIAIAAHATSGRGTVTTAEDADTADETFTVALDTANLPSSVTAGSPSSVRVRIRDDDGDGGTPPVFSSDAALSGLTASAGTDGAEFRPLALSPAFDASTARYAATVPYAATHARLTPTANREDATVKVGLRGAMLTEVASGEPGPAIALEVGENVIDVEVTPPSGTDDRQTYTVTITRRAKPTAPAFAGGDTVVFAIAENHAEGAVVGAVPATDEDGNELTYSLAATALPVIAEITRLDPEAFSIDAGGTIRVAEGVTLDYEHKTVYGFTARVSDGEDAEGNAEHTPTVDDTVEVTVTVENVEEPPGPPTDVTVAGASHNRLTVRWTAPADTGARRVTDYDVRWFAGEADPADEADWIEPGEPGGHDHRGTATEAAIEGLEPATAYRIQVRASGDGTGPWSDSAARTTLAQATAPRFHGGFAGGIAGARAFIAENHEPEAVVGTLAASDEDGDTLIFSLSSGGPLAGGGTDHEAFTIDAQGTVRVAPGVTLDYEEKSAWNFTAEVSDGEDAAGNVEDMPSVDDTIEVEIRVENVEEPPGPPTGLVAASAGPDRLEVTWTAPTDTGARLHGYEVQYRTLRAAEWTDHPHAGAATSTVIGGLAARSVYEVRVRALGDGHSAWTTGEGRTAVAAPEATGALADLTLVAGGPAVQVDAAAAFTGDEMVFAFASSDAAVVSFDGFGAVAVNEGATAALRAESAGEATVTVTAGNAGGSASVAFAVTVRAVSDEEAAALGLSLDGLTRTLLSGATGVIGARMAASETPARTPGSLTLADGWAAPAGLAGWPAPAAGGVSATGHPVAADRLATGQGTVPRGGWTSGNGPLPRNGLLSHSDLWNRSFAFSLAPGAPGGGQSSGGGQIPAGVPAPTGGGQALPRWTVWGTGDIQTFNGGEGPSRYDGEWRTAYLGADRRFGERWMGGVAVAGGSGEAEYAFEGPAPGTGLLETDLTAVYPYVKGVLQGGTELWATLGAGTGEARNVRSLQAGITHEGDLSMTLAAAGLRHALTDWRSVRVSVLADAGTAGLDIDGDASLVDLESTAYRARAGLELSGVGAFSPYLQLNARYDGGGEVSEAGYEAEAGLRHSGVRFDFELRGRWMALSGDADYEESGATATFRIKSAPDGTGLSASLTPSWGRPGGMDFVWGDGPKSAMQPRPGAEMGMTLNAVLGYGIGLWRLRGLVTPMLGYGRGAFGGDRLRFGADYATNPDWLPLELRVGFGVQRRQTLDGPNWGGELRAAMRW